MMLGHRIVIRPATADDSRGILECLASAFEPYRARYTPGAYLDTVLTSETIAQRLESMQVFVAITADDQIVGTIACSCLRLARVICAAWPSSRNGNAED